MSLRLRVLRTIATSLTVGSRRIYRETRRTIAFVAFGVGCALAVDHFHDRPTVLAHPAVEFSDGFTPSRLQRRNPEHVRRCVAEILEAVGDTVLSTSSDDCEQYAADPSFHQPVLPDAVVRPSSTEEVQQIVSICNRHKVPIVAFGGGTSLEGHVLPREGGIVISFENMRSIVELHERDLDVVVQPGIPYVELNEVLSTKGLFFSPDPGAGATVGGMIATSCGGPNAVRYGTMKDNVLSLKVVLANGEVVKTRARTRKCSAGYDLTHLFVGSEGTLGIITEATLRLRPLPTSRAVATAVFPSIQDAAELAIRLNSSSYELARVELLDEVAVKAVNLSTGLDLVEGPTVLFELVGSSSSVEEQVLRLQSEVESCHGTRYAYSTKEEEAEILWTARKEAYWSAYSLVPNREIWTTDVCVPISAMAEIVEATKKELGEAGIVAPLVAHLGDGNFHFLMLLNSTDAEELQRATLCNDRMVRRAIELGGTCTGEHGVGEGKKQFLEVEYGVEALAMMKALKTLFDPNNIMNPGKIVDLESDRD